MSARNVFRLLSPQGRRGRLTTLIFHRVHARRDPLFPGEPDAQEFERKMLWVKRWFNVLPGDEAVRHLRAASLPERALCVTFDDGYADNFTVALPILQRLGVPATFFVASGFLDGGRMWNDTIIEAIRGCAADSLDLSALGLGTHTLHSPLAKRAAIDTLLSRLKYCPPMEREARAAAVAEATKSTLPSDLMMTSEEIGDLKRAGMTIGAHTHRHPILAKILLAEAEQDIRLGVRRLESIIGEPVTLFAYPNGQPNTDYGVEHVQLVRSIGFEAAFSTAHGSASRRSDPFQLPRFTPWGDRSCKYAARLLENLWGNAACAGPSTAK